VDNNVGMSRRGLLRAAGVTGLAVATTGAWTLGSAGPASAAQPEWFWCDVCQGLYFMGGQMEGDVPLNGVCPNFYNPRGPHGAPDTEQFEYSLKFNVDGGRGQSGWAYCMWCRGLFFARNGHSAPSGKCPGSYTGLGHLPPFGSNYRIEYENGGRDRPGGQNQWAWCHLCEGMWFNGNGDRGYCPGAVELDGHHAATDSANYILRVAVYP
jgi:hypothetical protein